MSVPGHFPKTGHNRKQFWKHCSGMTLSRGTHLCRSFIHIGYQESIMSRMNIPNVIKYLSSQDHIIVTLGSWSNNYFTHLLAWEWKHSRQRQRDRRGHWRNFAESCLALNASDLFSVGNGHVWDIPSQTFINNGGL